MSQEYNIQQTTVDRGSIEAYSSLLSKVFNNPKLFTYDYLKWQYADNPDGTIVGFNAFSSDSLAAHYVTQPMQAIVGSQKKKGLLSLNTATHPDHQGKGLFVKLADRTYQYAADNGYDFVIGVANQNSVHGFTKKLGFKLVGQLNALLGIGNLPFSDDMGRFSYSRYWTPDALAWRLANPNVKYGVSLGHSIVISSPTAYPSISATLGVFKGSGYSISPQKAPFSLLNLWIGANKDITSETNLYFNIPNRLRPAPLYLIFKSLKDNISPVNFDDVYFQALDFDAY
jgi:GNAT superfamily N-acetyltransferase